MNATSLITFLRIAGRLKRVKRTGWVEAGVPDPESVADHSYRVALISMVLADSRSLDALKAVKMAILHDLPEVLTGDLTPEQKAINYAAAEAQAFQNAVACLSEGQRKQYTELFREYGAGDTPEAILVHTADRLDMVIQALEYEVEGVESSKLDRFWDVHIQKEYEALLSALKKLRAGRV